jgi:hypothetical protein
MSEIENTLGLRSMEDALRDFQGARSASPESDIDETDIEEDYDPFTLPAALNSAHDVKISEHVRSDLGERMLAGRDAEERLDSMHDSLIGHAETLVRLAMELDPGKAPRAFEVANAIIKNAMDAVNSKRDHELKTLRLMLDQQKFEHDKNSNDGAPVGVTDSVVAVMTTADMVRNFRRELDSAPAAETRTTPTDK